MRLGKQAGAGGRSWRARRTSRRARAGQPPAASPGASPPRKLRFAVIPKSLDLPVFNYAQVGAEREAKELGNVEILWRGAGDGRSAPPEGDPRVLHHPGRGRHRDLVARTATSSPRRSTGRWTRGIPVVTWDADAPKSKRIAFYGVDDVAAGRIMGEEAAQPAGRQGQRSRSSRAWAPTNLQRRLEGVREVLAKQPGMQIVEVYDIKEDSVRCAEIIADRQPPLSRPRGLDLGRRLARVHAQCPRRRGSREDEVHLLRHHPPAPDLLREGKVQVLLGQKYFGWGSEPVRILSEFKAGKPPASPIVDSGVDVVTKDNVDAYVARLEEAGGRAVNAQWLRARASIAADHHQRERTPQSPTQPPTKANRRRRLRSQLHARAARSLDRALAARGAFVGLVAHPVELHAPVGPAHSRRAGRFRPPARRPEPVDQHSRGCVHPGAARATGRTQLLNRADSRSRLVKFILGGWGSRSRLLPPPT